MYVCIPKIRFESKPYLLIYFPFLDHVKNMYVCPEEESILTSSFVSTLSALSIKQGDLPPQTHTCSINTIHTSFTEKVFTNKILFHKKMAVLTYYIGELLYNSAKQRGIRLQSASTGLAEITGILRKHTQSNTH